MLINNLTKLNRTSRNSVLAALVIIAGIAIYNWIAAPHFNYLHAAQSCDLAVDKIVERNKAITLNLESKRKELKKSDAQYSQHRSLMFTPDEAKEFFGELQNLFEETGCTVNSLNLVVSKPSKQKKQSQNTSDIIANSAMLSVTGQFHNIMKLVGKMQSRTQKVCVDSFKININDFSSGLLKCDMNITIYTIQDKEFTP